MYEQVYTPNINIPAKPAKCLQYIDDAGNAPERSPTAKSAFLKEQTAGRVKLSEFPNKVWVVAWFEFTKGSYTYPNGYTIYYKDAWHIAFVRRDGNTLEIHDSEVHSGSRKSYGSIGEIEAWFVEYGTKYVGWSTNCDGRQYAKEINMPYISDEELKDLRQWKDKGIKLELAITRSKAWKTDMKEDFSLTQTVIDDLYKFKQDRIKQDSSSVTPGLQILKPGKYEVV